MGALLLAACGHPAPAPAVAQADAAMRCRSLASFAAERLRITQAEWIEAGRVHAIDPATRQASGTAVPAHCLVRGRLDERIGSDGEPYHTGFELRLPAPGNGRLIQQGGDDGVLDLAVGRNTGARGWDDHGLARGYAAVSNDGGHQSPEPDYGLDAQARVEQAWRAHWRTAIAARALFQRFHGQAPQRNYFVGCGEGGRQGMMFTQRFPELFDGVVAQAPAMRASQGAVIAAAWAVQQLLRVAPAGADPGDRLARALTPAQLDRVATVIRDRCDAADGLVDGLVGDTALCRIRPQALRCAPGEDACLSEALAGALSAVMAGPTTGAGTRLQAGFPWDPGIAAPGWRAWMLGGPDGEPARHLSRLSRTLGLVYATPPDATLTLQNFDFERDPLRLEAVHRVHGTADDVSLRGFQRRGGRLLLVHGMADPLFSALDTVDYQQRVNAAHGDAAAARFVRTFLVPGMNHCAGGPATDDFDGLTAIVDWVEHGRAPERIVARGSGALPGLERPLCPWPRIARYRGGDSALAGSFDCR